MSVRLVNDMSVKNIKASCMNMTAVKVGSNTGIVVY